jgi:cytochrome c553
MLPLAGLGAPPDHVPQAYYYKIPEIEIPKTYSVYAPGSEPPAYMEWLKQQEPAVAVDFKTISRPEQWIEAGRIVFNAPFRAALTTARSADEWRSRFGGSPLYPRAAKDGTYPWVRYWVVKKGDVRAFFTTCGSCHTRVLDDGTVVPGAQGNLNESYYHASNLERGTPSLEQWKAARARQYGAPWLTPDPAREYETLSLAEALQIERAVVPGVRFRLGSSHLYPPKIPDLIGVRDRRYLDATGLVQHRSIGDLMRYAAMVDVAEGLASFKDFRPNGPLRDPSSMTRYSDSALYALAQYIYSLSPPSNPNLPTALSRRGEAVFQRAGCPTCHTPPLYTNNRLTPAAGFAPPEAHRATYSITDVGVGTDNRLAMRSRKGTGYYRVPSLRGVWYRGPFEHNGSVASLEEWFSDARLGEKYVPVGNRKNGDMPRQVPGHSFGLKLSPEDKSALVAFLKTL